MPDNRKNHVGEFIELRFKNGTFIEFPSMEKKEKLDNLKNIFSIRLIWMKRTGRQGALYEIVLIYFRPITANIEPIIPPRNAEAT